LLAKVEEGEEVIIARRGKPVAKIVAIKNKPAKNRVLGQDKGVVVIADDFDDPVDPETWR
jgi:antitoxin (DNA-binding transcriptional repressor) of toxin-antitoxin stability system